MNKELLQQALDALYSEDVDQQSWAKTALMKAIAQPEQPAPVVSPEPVAVSDALREIVALSAGWDEYGSIGPKPPMSWESVGRLAMDYAKSALAPPQSTRVQPVSDKKYAAKEVIRQEAGKGVFSMFNACMYKEQCRAAIKQTATQNEQLQEIIAAAYQIAGVYDAPVHVLDVLSSPLMATQEQIDALLPFQIVQPVQQNLQKRLADLHLYEEIAEHYAKCAVSPEALRDWVAAAIQKRVTS